MDMEPEEWMRKPAAEPSAMAVVKEKPAVEPMSVDDPTDDFEIMLLHEDAPTLLKIATKVKQTRKSIGKILHTRTQPFHQPASKSSLQPDEVLTVVERMQRTLLLRPYHTTIPRGRNPVTDSIMEDAMLTLQREYDCASQWLEKRVNGPKPMATMHDDSHDMMIKTKREHNGKIKHVPIGVKYAKWQTDILMNWMIENYADPFPSPDTIENLANRTGLSILQIVNWTTNVRKRNRKATCENGKKPYHFLDFVFLAHDRKKKQENGFMAREPPQQPQQPQVVRNYRRLPIQQHVQRPQPPQSTPSMPLPLAHRNSPPPTVRQGNHPVPEEHISRDIFEEALDNFEPLNALEKHGESIIFDFASSWPDNYSQENRTLLPSVTNDNYDPPRARSNSLDIHVDDDEVPKNYLAEE